MKQCVFLCFLLALAFVFPAATVLAENPSVDDMATYNKEAAALEMELQAYIDAKAKQPPGMVAPDSLVVFERNFSVTKKSSSITRALRRAKDSLTAELNAWINSVAAQGYAPVENPEPISKLDHKWGISGFKFYVRLKLYLKMWCIKMPGSS